MGMGIQAVGVRAGGVTPDSIERSARSRAPERRTLPDVVSSSDSVARRRSDAGKGAAAIEPAPFGKSHGEAHLMSLIQ